MPSPHFFTAVLGVCPEKCYLSRKTGFFKSSPQMMI